MDLATMMSMLGGQGGAAPESGGMQLPAAQLGAAQMGGQPQGPGFGLGQQMMQGDPGATQYAQPQTMQGQLQSMMGGAQMNPELMAKIGPMLQMLQQRNAQQGAQQMPQMMNMMQQHGGQQANNTQAARGYLSNGGGLAGARY